MIKGTERVVTFQRKEKKKEEWIYPSSGRICKVQMKLKLPSTRNAVAAEIHCACIVVLQAGTHLPLLYRSVSLSRAQVPHGIVGDRRPCPEGGWWQSVTAAELPSARGRTPWRSPTLLVHQVQCAPGSVAGTRAAEDTSAVAVPSPERRATQGPAIISPGIRHKILGALANPDRQPLSSQGHRTGDGGPWMRLQGCKCSGSSASLIQCGLLPMNSDTTATRKKKKKWRQQRRRHLCYSPAMILLLALDKCCFSAVGHHKTDQVSDMNRTAQSTGNREGSSVCQAHISQILYNITKPICPYLSGYNQLFNLSKQQKNEHTCDYP